MSTLTPRAADRDRLYRAIGDVLGLPSGDVDDTTSPETVTAWDSLNHLNIVMAIEQEFALSLSVDEALEMRSVASIRAVLARHGIDC
jgi:acyl carrier protein